LIYRKFVFMAMVFLFPGQGSQKPGMGADFHKEFDSVRKRFNEANEILGRDLRKICFEGPAEELTATQNTQPALFTVESAVCDCIRERGVVASLVLGHSLGEYSALYAAGVFSFSDGLRIVAKRGSLMARAGSMTKGAMAAVIGLARDAIANVLGGCAGVVVPANENSPDQTVISGEAEAVKEAGEKMTAAGAKRVINLPVSGAFHSPLMKSAADEFAAFLASFSFNTAGCGVVSNVTAKAETDPLVIRDLLVRQLTSPVRWVDSMEFLKQQNALSCVEIGPGNVLKGLARKCAAGLNVVSCETVDNLYSLSE
jgi:[acyl-carrier-protein] S-malonyltransferase